MTLGIAAALLLSTGCGDDRSTPPPATPSAPAAVVPPPDPGATPPPAASPSAPSAATPPAATPPAAAPAAPPASASGAAPDGKAVYMTYCVTCHGPEGKGDGPGAAALEPKPRDFTAGQFKFDPNGDGKTGEPEDLIEVVKNGAAKYGGSPNMVPWGAVIPEPQIRALVTYVKSLSKH